MIRINDDYSVDPAAVREAYTSNTNGWAVVLTVQVGAEKVTARVCVNLASREEAQQIKGDIVAEINSALRSDPNMNAHHGE